MRFTITLFLLFITVGLWSQMPGIIASQETSISGDEVSIIVSVDDFENIVGLQFTLEWDPAILAYQSTGDYAIPGLNEFNFGETDTDSGILTFVWFDGLVDGVSLADGTAIFTVTFTAIGQIGDVSEVAFIDTPTPTQIGIIDGIEIQEVAGEFTNGQVEIVSNELMATGTVNHVRCFEEANGSVMLNVFGGVAPYEFSWTGPANFEGTSATIENLIAGEYALTITDENNNIFSSTFDVLQPDELIIEEILLYPSDCDQPTGSIELTVSGGFIGYTYDFGNGFGPSATANNLAAGEYNIQVMDANNCSLDTLVEITQGNAPIVDLGVDTAICAGQNLLLTADEDEGLTYEWTFNEMPLPDMGNELLVQDFGTYTLTVTNGANCAASDELILSEATAPPVDLGEDTALCAGDAITLSAPEGLSYEWTLNGMPLSEMSNELLAQDFGTYAITVTNANNCSASDELIFSEAVPPSIDLGEDIAICDGDVITLYTPEGLSYEWFQDGIPLTETSDTLIVEKAAVYLVIATNAEGCSSEDEIIITQAPAPMLDLGMDILLCAGSTTSLFAEPGMESYQWSLDGETVGTNDQELEVTAAGVYSVNVINAEGCSASDELTVDIISFTATASPDTTILAGDTLQLFATGGVAYSWSTNVDLSCFDCPDPMLSLAESATLEVVIESAEGCRNSILVEITVEERPEVEIDIVNWLSPNGDGKNDVLKFRGLENYNSNQLSIYNRWGDLLYNKANYQLDGVYWDATFKGQPVPDGVYFYVLKVKSTDIVFKNSLTIVRE